MGKRKKAAKAPTKKRSEPLATTFPCLFCNHENAVSCKIDKKTGVGHLSCKVCDQSFHCSINYLSAPVDVYSDWVDACDQVAKETKAGESSQSRYTTSAARKTTRDDDDEDGYGGYGGEGIVDDDDDY